MPDGWRRVSIRSFSSREGERRRTCAAAVALAVLALPAAVALRAQDGNAVIAASAAAIGVDALKTVQYSATGFDFALGQSYNPSSPWPKFIKCGNATLTRAGVCSRCLHAH